MTRLGLTTCGSAPNWSITAAARSTRSRA